MLTDILQFWILSSIADKHLCQFVIFTEREYPEKVNKNVSNTTHFASNHSSHNIS